MCSQGVSRPWAVIAALFCLLESLGYLGLGIAALTLYHCEIPIDLSWTSQIDPNIDPGGAVYFIYFYNPNCSWSTLNSTLGWINNVTLPTAERTWQWAIAYTAVSGAWVVTSLFMLAVGVAWCRGGCARKFVPGLWLLVTLTVLVMDVVATIQYGLDIGQIVDGGVIALLRPLVTSGSPVEKWLSTVEVGTAVLPSVALTLATSRCLLLWTVNLVLWLGVFFTSVCSRAQQDNSTHRDGSASHPPRPKPAAPEQDRRLAAAGAAGGARGTPSASSTVRPDELMWRGGPQLNPSYQAYDEVLEEHQGPVIFRRSHSNDELHLAGRGSRQSLTPMELRGQLPWSYLHPTQGERPISPHRHSPSSPPLEEEVWSGALRLPRPHYTSTTGHQPSSVPGNHMYPQLQQPQFYHYPYSQSQQPQYNPRYEDVKSIYNNKH